MPETTGRFMKDKESGGTSKPNKLIVARAPGGESPAHQVCDSEKWWREGMGQDVGSNGIPSNPLPSTCHR